MGISESQGGRDLGVIALSPLAERAKYNGRSASN